MTGTFLDAGYTVVSKIGQNTTSGAYSLVGVDSQQGEGLNYIIWCHRLLSDVTEMKQRRRVGRSDLEGRVFPFKAGESAHALLSRRHLTLAHCCDPSRQT